jgi:hypothetical protein
MQSSVSRSAIERAKPATKREISIELEKLRSVFGYEETAWATAAELYIDALSDVPYDLLAEAVTATIRMAGPNDRFPKPGQLRGLVSDRLEGRRRDAHREKHPSSEAWPDWLSDLWGPEPLGPIARAVAGKHRDDSLHESALWRLNDRPLLPQGMTVSDWIAAGKPAQINGQKVSFGDQPRRSAATSDTDEMRDLQDALGLKATEA